MRIPKEIENALKPLTRCDLGRSRKLPKCAIEKIYEYRKQMPYITVKKIYTKLIYNFTTSYALCQSTFYIDIRAVRIYNNIQQNGSAYIPLPFRIRCGYTALSGYFPGKDDNNGSTRNRRSRIYRLPYLC